MYNSSKVLKGFSQQLYDTFGKLIHLLHFHKKRLQPKELEEQIEQINIE